MGCQRKRSMKQRVVVGISGASGAALGVRVVELLSERMRCEVHLVISQGGERTLGHEVGANALDRLDRLVARRHPVTDIGGVIASGSFRTAGMIIAPCSIRTLSAIAYSAADNLLIRTADVHLKERRRLVLVVRESPLHLGHIRAMAAATEYGAIIAPPVPAFYFKPRTVDDVLDDLARRSVALLDLPASPPAVEWAGLPESTLAGDR